MDGGGLVAANEAVPEPEGLVTGGTAVAADDDVDAEGVAAAAAA